jgi:hypothetical protein
MDRREWRRYFRREEIGFWGEKRTSGQEPTRKKIFSTPLSRSKISEPA